MTTNSFQKLIGGALALLACAVLPAAAQQRTGGGGFGGGGFGFGGFGGGGFNRASSAGSTTASYNNNGSVGNAVISVDPVTHNIVVIADKETSEQIKQVIASLDAPEAQVLIRAVFLEVTDSKASDIGVQGAYTGQNGTLLTNVNMGQNFGLPQTLSGATGPGGMYQIMGSDYNATFQAIAATGKAQVLSRPSILARDGQMAEIVVGQSIYLPSGVSFTSVGGSTTTIPTINGNYENVGIQLDVTPFIGANSLIQMIIEPQITSIDNSSSGQQIVGSSLFSGAVFAPNINKRSANTVVVTPDGQTVVVGGLIANQKSQNDSKVPFLGDIPVLGNLFKFSAKSNEKTELMIFLTPHIVVTPSQLTALTLKESAQAPMITNSITEEELDRFLERVPVKHDPDKTDKKKKSK